MANAELAKMRRERLEQLEGTISGKGFAWQALVSGIVFLATMAPLVILVVIDPDGASYATSALVAMAGAAAFTGQNHWVMSRRLAAMKEYVDLRLRPSPGAG